MVGQKVTVTLFAVSCIAAIGEAHIRAWSPYTWMRDKEDPKLSSAIREFFEKVAQEADDAVDEDKPAGDDTTAADDDELMVPIGNKKVRILEDTIISDYIAVNNWYWQNYNIPDDEAYDEDSEDEDRDDEEAEDECDSEDSECQDKDDVEEEIDWYDNDTN